MKKALLSLVLLLAGASAWGAELVTITRDAYDVNGDGVVDVLDVTAISNGILESKKGDKLILVDNTVRYAYDVNNDGTVDIVDLTIVANAILNSQTGEQLTIAKILKVYDDEAPFAGAPRK